MVANPHRRASLADAALEILGRDGSRALTHRAVDTAAGVPAGTSANYFPSRADLVLALAERVFDLLQPEDDRLATLAGLSEDEATPEYAADVTAKLLERPHLALALVELRLEAARSPEVRERLAPHLRAGFEADVAFHEQRGLGGGRLAVLALHHVVNGAVLDALTVPLDPDADVLDVVRRSASALCRP